MTSTVTEVTRSIIASATYDTLSTTFGLIVIGLLLLLLVQKELLRSHGGVTQQRAMRVLDIAILPLLVPFALIILMRLFSLLP